MLELHLISQNPKEAKNALAKRAFEPLALIDQVVDLDGQRKSTQFEMDSKQAEMNQLSKSIGELFKSGMVDEANRTKATTANLKQEIKQLSDNLTSIVAELHEAMVKIPNLPHELVPAGVSEEDNQIIRNRGDLRELDNSAKPHWELAEDYAIFDLEAGVKLTGSGFPVFRSQGAKLVRALRNFFLDAAAAEGYEEVHPPLLVNADTAYATGQLPDKEGQMYEMKEDPYFLIPTAEVPVTNLYRDVILNEADLPKKLCSYTQCFRREAGSYGAHVRGLNRVHQFDKVEIVQLQHPEQSYDTLDEMVAYVEGLLEKLGLVYRVSRLCGGDLGFTSALTYDMEVYSAAQKRWLEVSSISNFQTFQSNRLKLRYRDGKKTRLLHTLNGSALAFPRIIAALLENHQENDAILLPEVLHQYTGFQKLTRV